VFEQVFLALGELPGKILIHVTCKAYPAVNADRKPKYISTP